MGLKFEVMCDLLNVADTCAKENSALLFWKLFVSEFLLGISETLHCSMSAPHVRIVPLLDVHQLLILFAGTLTYSGPGTFSSVVFYNMLLLLLFGCCVRTQISKN
jgi:hypothetical protein